VKRVARGKPTLREAARTYLEDWRGRKGPATWDGDARLFGIEDMRDEHRKVTDPKAAKARRLLDETFAAKRLPDITKSDVESLRKRWPRVRFNRAVALLSHLFGHFNVEPNPCRKVARNDEVKRRRYLSGDELARLGKALAEADVDERAIAAIRVLLFTGARRSEILWLKWTHDEPCRGHVDFERGVAVLHVSKTGQKDLILPPAAFAVLRGIERDPKSPFVLPGDVEGRPFVGIGHAWAGANMTRHDKDGKPVRVHVPGVRDLAGLTDVRLHDLRHTAASVAVAGGASLPIIGAMLGHASTATTARYAHLALDPVRAVADQTAATLEAALNGKTAPKPVTSIAGRRRPA
jgi:integrase